MIQELLYTADSKGGLKGGGSGYSTVLSTEGMASNLAQALERLSGYKHPFDIHDPRAQQNTVNYRYVKIRIGGISYYVLSRIADLRRENTSRSNKLAHHLVLSNEKLPRGGPSLLLSQQGLCRTDWDNQVALVPNIPASSLPVADLPERPCAKWEEVAGDAGWAGVVAGHLISKPQAPINVIFPLGTDTLKLTQEVFSLLPPAKRWAVTFSTYFTTQPAGTTCSLRFLLDGTPEAENLRRDYRQTTVDLATQLGVPEIDEWVTRARTGKPLKAKPAPSQPHRDAVVGESGEVGKDGRRKQPFPVPESGDIKTLEPLSEDDSSYELERLPPIITEPGSTGSRRGAGRVLAGYQGKKIRKMGRRIAIACLVIAIISSFGAISYYRNEIISYCQQIAFSEDKETVTPENDEPASNNSSDENGHLSAGKAIGEEKPVGTEQQTGPKALSESEPTETTVGSEGDSDEESEAEDNAASDTTKQNPVTSSPKDDIDSSEKAGDMKLFLPDVKLPKDSLQSEDDESKPVSTKLPPDWLTGDAEAELSLVGHDDLNGQLHGSLSFDRPEDKSKRWALNYKSKSKDGLFGESKKIHIASFWIENKSLHFRWNEANKDMRKKLRSDERRYLFNGVRWCLLLLESEGKDRLLGKLSPPVTIREPQLVSELSEQRLFAQKKHQIEVTMLPKGSVLEFEAGLDLPRGDFRIENSTNNNNVYKCEIVFDPSPPGNSSAENRGLVPRLVSVEIRLVTHKTIKECAISTVCTIHWPSSELKTIEDLLKGGRPDWEFKQALPIKTLAEVKQYRTRVNEAQEQIRQKLDRMKEREEPQQKKPRKGDGKSKEEIKQDDQRKKLLAAKHSCETVIEALECIESISIKLSVSANYSNNKLKLDPVEIITTE